MYNSLSSLRSRERRGSPSVEGFELKGRAYLLARHRKEGKGRRRGRKRERIRSSKTTNLSLFLPLFSSPLFSLALRDFPPLVQQTIFTTTVLSLCLDRGCSWLLIRCSQESVVLFTSTLLHCSALHQAHRWHALCLSKGLRCFISTFIYRPEAVSGARRSVRPLCFELSFSTLSCTAV